MALKVLECDSRVAHQLITKVGSYGHVVGE
jgi:hypothetical protein